MFSDALSCVVLCCVVLCCVVWSCLVLSCLVLSLSLSPLPSVSLMLISSRTYPSGTMTRQDKTRQDKTRQDKTRQDKTRQDKTRQGHPIFRVKNAASCVCVLFSLGACRKVPPSQHEVGKGAMHLTRASNCTNRWLCCTCLIFKTTGIGTSGNSTCPQSWPSWQA
jgi:hypothetical protein